MSVPFIVDEGGCAIYPLAGVEPAPSGQQPHVWLRELLHRQPELLPFEALGTEYAPPVSLGCGIDTGSGELDNLFVSPLGRLTLVMIDVPRSQELRRPVDALLEHSCRISGWNCDQLRERAARQDVEKKESIGFEARLEHAQRWVGVSPAHFEGALQANLAEERFLLLVVGERVSADAYLRVQELQSASGLGVRLAIVELPFFRPRDERETWLLTVPRVVVGTSRGAPDFSKPGRRPLDLVPVATFSDPTSCRLFHDRLQAAGVRWRTHVSRAGADVSVWRLHERPARQLLQEHRDTHPEPPKMGFPITYDYAIFGSLIAGAFGMILMAVEFHHLSDLVRPLLLMLLGGVIGWVLEQGRISYRATGSCQFSPGDCLVACGAGLLAAILFLGGIAR